MKHQHGEDSTGEPHSQPILLPGNTATSVQSAHVVGVHPAGSGSQFCADPKSRAKPGVACCQPCLPICGRSGSRGIQVQGYQLGVSGRCTLLLAPPVVVGRSEQLVLAIEEANPQPGRSLHLPLPQGWALLYAYLPTAARRCSKIKILTATRSISLCSFIYR